MAKKPFIIKNGLSVNDTVVVGTNGKLHANNTISDDTITNAMLETDPSTLATWSSLTSTNTALRALITKNTNNIAQKLGATASVTLGGDVSGSGSFSSNSVSITVNVADDSHNHIISNVDGLQSALDAKATWSGLIATNTAIRTLVSDRMQVANTTTLVDAVWSGLTSTNTAIRALTTANATEIGDVWTGLIGTNTAIRALVSDRLQVANAAATYLPLTGGTISDDLIISGDLTVQGNTITVGTTNLSVSNNFIYLNDGGGNTNIDMGWAGGYNDGTYAHAGIFRDADDGRFKIFDSFTPEISSNTNIDTGHASYDHADLQVGTLYTDDGLNVTGNITVSGNVDGVDVAALSTTVDTKATWTALTGTNTAIRTLVSDRMQVANTTALVNDRIQVANLNTTLSSYWPSANTITYVDTQVSSVTGDPAGSAVAMAIALGG